MSATAVTKTAGEPTFHLPFTSTPSFTPTPNPNAPSATPTSAACLDAYEPDGTPNSATLLLIGEVQRNHTLCPAGDADWYKFFGGRGKAYTIATANLGVGVDTYMYLFDSDGKTVIAQNDDITGPPPSGNPNDVVSSAIQFIPIRDDFYYIMVKNKGDLGAPFMTYDISMEIQANVPPPAGSATPVIAPVVTVTFPPTAPPPTSFPLPTNPPPATAAPPTPLPLLTAPPTAGAPPLLTATAMPTVPSEGARDRPALLPVRVRRARCRVASAGGQGAQAGALRVPLNVPRWAERPILRQGAARRMNFRTWSRGRSYRRLSPRYSREKAQRPAG